MNKPRPTLTPTADSSDGHLHVAANARQSCSLRGIIILAALVLTIAGPSSVVAQETNYEDHVKPVFRDHCLKCHNADEQNADLDLSSYDALMKGGSSGRVVKAGLPDSSQLYRAMSHAEGVEPMPPESPKLAESKLKVVRDWIRGGLIPGKGGQSLLKTDMAFVAAKPGTAAPMPDKLPVIELTKTVRPPIPIAIAASPGAPLVAVSGQEQILLFGATRKKATSDGSKKSFNALTLIGVLPFPEGTIHDVKFSQTGSIIIAAGGRGSHSGKTVFFDVKTGRRVAEIGDEVDSVLAADISPDHSIVALGGPNKLVKLFEVKTGHVTKRIAKHTDWVTAVAFSPNGEFVATGDRSGGVFVWEANGAIAFTLAEHKVRVTDLAWRPDSRVLATAADDGTVIQWSMKDGFPTGNLAAHVGKNLRHSRQTGVLSLDYSQQGQLLTTGRNRRTQLWTGDGKKMATFAMNALPVSSAWLNDGKHFIVGHYDGTLTIRNSESSKVVQSLNTQGFVR